MVSSTDLLILAMGGLLAALYLYKDKLLGPSSPATAKSTVVPKANGVGGGKKYQGDPRDFVAKMKDGVSLLDRLSSCGRWKWASWREDRSGGGSRAGWDAVGRSGE